MAKHLIIEESSNNKPNILLVDTNSGMKNTLLDFLIESLGDKTKIYVLSQKRITGEAEKISPLATHLLDHVKDRIPYSVIFLDEEKEKKKVLDIVDKLSSIGTRILILIPYRISDRFVDVMLTLRDNKNVSVGLLGDIFGESNPQAPISKLLTNAFLYKEILLSGNELLSLYPIADIDAVSGVQHILFGVKNPSSIYSLFYEQPQTLISLSHLVKRQEPELSVKFGDSELGLSSQKTEGQKNKYFKDRLGVIPQRPRVAFLGFEKSIANTYSGLEDKRLKPKKKQLNVFKKKNVRAHPILRIIKYAIFGSVFYLLSIFIIFFSSLFFFKNGVSVLLAGKVDAAEKSFGKSKWLYEVSGPTVGFIVHAIPWQNSMLVNGYTVYDDLSAITPDVIFAAKNLGVGKSNLNSEELNKLITGTIEMYFLLQRYDLSQFKNTASSSTFIDSSRFISLAPVLGTVLGYDEEKNYLLLFQNNNELRPSGGFIGSIGDITIKNGEIKNITVQDVYDLDGQLLGHIDPPFALKRYLQPDLFLRDTSFYPDFRDTATSAALLYNMESNKKVDGVIGIDTEVLREILKVTGPINLSGNITVNSDNVSKLIEATIEEGFFPGSRQKKDTLNSLMDKIILTLTEDKAKQVKFIGRFPTLMAEKHVQFSFPNSQTQKAFEGAGYAGTLQDLRVGKGILPDFLSVNEANIGVNKINRDIERKIVYSAYLKPDLLGSDLSIIYTNKGSADYKAYIRLVIPKGASLVSITIDGKEQKLLSAITDPDIYGAKNFKLPEGLELDREIREDKTLIGFLTTVAKKSNQRINVVYQNPNIVPLDDNFVYSLLYIKQAGTSEYPLTVQLQTNDSYRVEPKESTPVLFDGGIKSDREFTKSVVRVK